MHSYISAFFALLATSLPAMAQDTERALHNVVGDVYLFQNNFHMSLVVPTTEGTVRVDPINAEAGEWLNANLGDITDQPVTHLIYSHSHGDHASGGAAHAGATIVAHESAPPTLDGTEPTQRVGDTHSLELGGKIFELTNLGSGHDTHMLAVVVRPENVAFIVDVAAPKRLPFRDFGGANIDDWIGQVETAMTLDFDVFAPGHGTVGNKNDLADHLTYLQDLRAGVLDGLKAGQSVDEIKMSLDLSAYSEWGQYEDWRGLNIEGMAKYLQTSGQVN
ncbi:Glyoxylase, beta-lactamase superfamily II [Litoreibacter janthinus]|uniref:Glyoxylase, beta-lactamase superfamily II n=2 Tax=Litoreibacter janthinus TaxID=670154 RepID=A0A1I6FRN5_9RHOB|nr:Glyoxylase, beta-lactamase superfamily II [Litoreibacter janthinus]